TDRGLGGPSHRVRAFATGLQIGHVGLEERLDRRRSLLSLLFTLVLLLQLSAKLAFGLGRLPLAVAEPALAKPVECDASLPALPTVDLHLPDRHGVLL